MMHYKGLPSLQNVIALGVFIREYTVILVEFQQEGSLCAQHCLNALLQGPYFSAVDLAEIARQLDETEREQMAVGGTDNEGYRQFLEVTIFKGNSRKKW